MNESRSSDSQIDVAIRQPIPLWTLGGLGPVQLMMRSVRGFSRNQLDARSAQFAFNALLAGPPLLILLIACTTRLPSQAQFDSALEAAGRLLPDEDIRKAFVTQVEDIKHTSKPQLVMATLMVLAFAGSRLITSLGAGLNAAFEVNRPRRYWRQRGIAVLLTFGMLLLFLAALVLLVVGPMLTELVLGQFDLPILGRVALALIRGGVLCGLLLLSTAALYSWVPTRGFPWHWVSPGSLFATIGWILASAGFRLYVENFGRYNETYGALGGVIVLLIWLYLAGAILLLGGQINSVIRQASLEKLKD